MTIKIIDKDGNVVMHRRSLASDKETVRRKLVKKVRSTKDKERESKDPALTDHESSSNGGSEGEIRIIDKDGNVVKHRKGASSELDSVRHAVRVVKKVREPKEPVEPESSNSRTSEREVKLGRMPSRRLTVRKSAKKDPLHSLMFSKDRAKTLEDMRWSSAGSLGSKGSTKSAQSAPEMGRNIDDDELEDDEPELSPEEIEAQKKEACYSWYTRMGQPKRADMKKRVRQMQGCDIEVEDVDLLPWIMNGARVNIAEMNRVFLRSSKK